jgi:hypothetical protein
MSLVGWHVPQFAKVAKETLFMPQNRKPVVKTLFSISLDIDHETAARLNTIHSNAIALQRLGPPINLHIDMGTNAKQAPRTLRAPHQT